MSDDANKQLSLTPPITTCGLQVGAPLHSGQFKEGHTPLPGSGRPKGAFGAARAGVWSMAFLKGSLIARKGHLQPTGCDWRGKAQLFIGIVAHVPNATRKTCVWSSVRNGCRFRATTMFEICWTRWNRSTSIRCLPMRPKWASAATSSNCCAQVTAIRPMARLEPRLLIDRRAVDQKSLDGGAARGRHCRDDRQLALIAGLFELPALAFRDEVAFAAASA